MSYCLVLDAEPVSRMAHNHRSADDVYAYLEAATRLNRRVYTPACVMAELFRGAHRQTIYAWYAKMQGLAEVVDTDMFLADQVGGVLFAAGAGSDRIVDAHCVAVVNAQTTRGMVLTGDPDDVRDLASNYPNVVVAKL